MTSRHGRSHRQNRRLTRLHSSTLRVFDKAEELEESPVRRMRPRDATPRSPAASSPPLSRRRFLQGAAGLTAVVVLGAWPELADAATLPTLTATQLTGAMAGLPKTGYVRLPGGGRARAVDVRAAAAAFAVGDPSTPDPATNPVAALGVLVALAAWSGHTGSLDLTAALPKAPVRPLRLGLPRLPAGASTDTLPGAVPPRLVVRPGGSLVLIGTLSGKRLLVALEDPARQVAGHHRLELAVLRAADLAPLLAVLHAKLDSTGTTVLLASGSKVPLRPLQGTLATRLLHAAGVRFVDQNPIQPLAATTPLLTVEPIVPAPPASLGLSAVHIAPAANGRILALNAGGTAVGRAQYIGGTPAWDWHGSDGLDLALRELTDAIGWRVGTAIDGAGWPKPSWQAIVRAQFNQVTVNAGLYWSEVEPAQGQFVFGFPDLQVAFAEANAQRIRGHPLVWAFPDLLPTWISDGNLTPTQLADAMTNHVTQLVSRYRGRVAEWVVVNEPGDYLSDPFAQRIGPQYLEMAFSAARAADPDALLILNNFADETSMGWTTSATRSVASQLAAAGLVDRVGLQMHLDGAHPPDPSDVVRTMQSYPVPVCVTEFDIDLSDVPGTQDQRWAVQATIAASMLRAAHDSGVCESFTVWGIGDGGADSWLAQPGTPLPMATPFDGNLKPKPFFGALLKGLA